MKQCRACGVEKPLSEFYSGRAKCKACHNKQLNDKRRKDIYGVTPEEYNQLFEKQKGCCAICGVHASTLKRSLHLDHCHSTGKVRGLLCSNCNTAIGKLNDNEDTLYAAIKYLRASKE